jgi:hypothetical protein
MIGLTRTELKKEIVTQALRIMADDFNVQDFCTILDEEFSELYNGQEFVLKEDFRDYVIAQISDQLIYLGRLREYFDLEAYVDHISRAFELTTVMGCDYYIVA